ncbi:MAG: hypothetical protein HWQ43_27860 [Nostoc sp. JL31]|uniref:hypothetical protein n=1 Tax=Nostoc sp. JL31 TaxID=2815395 RepID=UPI0025FB883C|nr:hypothetical protein [Nostoc sp. JL31]MBN3892785.1 hypothetical protein [Nostoc sp. JL31]
MFKYYLSLSYPYEDLSDIELQTLVERFFQPSEALQELPLIVIPEYLLSLSVEMKQQHPFIKQAIQEWLEYARKDDECLRIERRWIPHTPVYIPNTSKGKQFFKIAKAIGEIPLTASVLPKNQNQGYWLKTLNYFWQARGVVLAQQMLGLMEDPLEKGGIFSNRLPLTSLNNLKLIRELDIACFQVLARGQRIIQQWAAQNEITYPFSKPLELFVEILKQDFLVTWQLGPCNRSWQWIPKQKQRDYLVTRAYLLREGIWQESLFDSAYDCKRKQEYLEYLQGAGWNGYWILAMRSQMQRTGKYNKHLEPYLEAYLNAFIESKELCVDEFDWRSGQPYKKRVNGQQITNSPGQVQGIVDSLGYIQWCWT